MSKTRITLFLTAAWLTLGQPAPAKWVGSWTLNVQKSTFGTILIPGAPTGLTIVSQTLKIEQSTKEIKLSGDAVTSDSSGAHSGHEENSLSLDGKELVAGPVTFSFRRIDESSFDIVSKLNIGDRNFGEVSHFAFSADGKALIETKTQTERDAEGRMIRTAKSVLVFARTV